MQKKALFLAASLSNAKQKKPFVSLDNKINDAFNVKKFLTRLSLRCRKKSCVQFRHPPKDTWYC